MKEVVRNSMSFFAIENPIRWLFLVHAVCGTLALLVFIVPLLSKKGGKWHVEIGWLYIAAMMVVSLSAFIITPWRFFYDPERSSESQGFSLFLFFISLLTLSFIVQGMSALKTKSRKKADFSWRRWLLPTLLFIAAVIVQFQGYKMKSPLLLIFPITGYLSAVGQLRYWMTPPKEKYHWWIAHLESMGGACIATVTAFLVTALPRLSSSIIFNSPILWIAPGVIGGILIQRATRKFRAGFEASNHS